MQPEVILKQFAQIVDLPVFVLRNGVLEHRFQADTQDVEFLRMIRSSLPEALPEAWTSSAPEDFYAVGFRLPQEEAEIWIAPVFTFECSIAQARRILIRLGHSPERAAAFQNRMNRRGRFDLKHLQTIVKFLYALCCEEENVLIKDLPFHWAAPRRTVQRAAMEPIMISETNDLENQIVAMVRSGKTEELRRFFNETLFVQSGPQDTGIEDVQQLRRYMLGANMYMSRIAASEGVDLVLINEIADSFGRRIEKTTAFADFNHLFSEFSERYTKLVADLHAFSSRSYLANQVNRYVQSHIYEKISLETVAADLQYSRSHVCAEFKKATGMTLTSFIAHCKVREAEYLLERYHLPVAEISEALGFFDVSYFIKVFRKYTGKTPGQAYR